MVNVRIAGVINKLIRLLGPTILLTALTLAACQNNAPPTPIPAGPPVTTGPTNLSFYKAADSNDWVRHTLIVQKRYSRVLLVSHEANPPRTISVGFLDPNTAPLAGVAREHVQTYTVTQVFPTIQEAADASRGGDLVAVMPGKYLGFVVDGERSQTGDGLFIHFKAMGQPGDVIIDQVAARDDRWMIKLTNTHHIIVEGFDLDGKAYAGAPATRPQRDSGPVDSGGILVGEGFKRTGLMTHHIIVLNNFSHDHEKWGMHTNDTHTVLVQGNVFCFSRRQHGLYVSDGSDDYVIRRNVFMGNYQCGLQCNLDVNSSMTNLLANPRMHDFTDPDRPLNEWVPNVLKAATERFGENNFPDGRGLNFIIEQNVSCGNGKNAGGAFNLSGLQQSIVQNNLLYDNHAHGMAFYGQGDKGSLSTIQSPEQVTGPDALPYFGSHDNLARNNTIVMNSPSRGAMMILGGSYGCKLRNNIIINDADDSVHADSFSIWKLDSDYNVVGRTAYSTVVPGGYWPRRRPTTMPQNLQSLATHLDDNDHSKTGVTGQQLAEQVARFGMQPWVIIEGNWWKLNPDRPDFHPKAGSTLLAGKGDRENMPGQDLDGNPRKSADIGAYATAP